MRNKSNADIYEAPQNIIITIMIMIINVVIIYVVIIIRLQSLLQSKAANFSLHFRALQ
jgi:hypothetical protein